MTLTEEAYDVLAVLKEGTCDEVLEEIPHTIELIQKLLAQHVTDFSSTNYAYGLVEGLQSMINYLHCKDGWDCTCAVCQELKND